MFQLHSKLGDASLDLVRDAYTVCSCIQDEQHKCDCYAMYGLDGKNVERYLHAVEDMQHVWDMQNEQDRKEKATHIQIGPIHIYLYFDTAWWDHLS